MQPDYTDGLLRLYHADCRDVLPHVQQDITAVVSDPPYGCKNDCNYTRFSGGLSPHRNFHKGIKGDDTPFDPAPWLTFPKVVLFGYQFFAPKLPIGTILVWLKKRDNQLGSFLSDCELAWMKGGKGCYLFPHVWHGFDRQTERGKTLHPSQKPVSVMEWVMQRAKITPADVVIDPYMGSGATALACRNLGIPFVGCEIEQQYFDIAVGRVRHA